MRIKSVQYSHMGIFSHMRAVFGRIMRIYIYTTAAVSADCIRSKSRIFPHIQSPIQKWQK